MDGMLCDGAFFGELPVLALGNGWLHNQHICTAVVLTTAHMCILRREDLADIERDNPSLKGQIRELALDRANRFGLKLDRITLTCTVEQQRRRVHCRWRMRMVLRRLTPTWRMH